MLRLPSIKPGRPEPSFHSSLSLSPQTGFVSIIVAALIMVILSLITIGFTRIMQREQRQALDRQLSRQAIYAAESGVNDIYTSLQHNANLPSEKTTCDVEGDVAGGQPNPAVNGGIIDQASGVGYTCALYDKTPTELIYSVGSSESKVVELKTESGAAFSILSVRWSNEQGDNNVDTLPRCGEAGARLFPPTRPGNVPLIRLDLTNTSNLARENLIDGTDYLYLSPCKEGAPATTYAHTAGAPKGQVVEVACFAAATIPCELSITGLNANSYVARFRSIYASAQLLISATESAGNQVEFRDAQTSIDVTAKANDVVRRLRVAIPRSTVNNPPEAVFQAFDGVCKLLSVDAVSTPPRVTDSCGS